VEVKPMHRGLALFAALLNVVAAVATIITLLERRVQLATDWQPWVYAWSVLPYVVLALIGWLLGRDRSTAAVGLLGTMLFVVLGLCAILMAPSVALILLLPAVQLVGCGVVLLCQMFRAHLFGAGGSVAMGLLLICAGPVTWIVLTITGSPVPKESPYAVPGRPRPETTGEILDRVAQAAQVAYFCLGAALSLLGVVLVLLGGVYRQLGAVRDRLEALESRSRDRDLQP
jgi:hypothetical protein